MSKAKKKPVPLRIKTARKTPGRKSAADKAKQRARWREQYHAKWADGRNKVRRDKYGADDDYRKQQQQAARQAYRDKNGGVREVDCRENIAELGSIGVVRTIYVNEVAEQELCFTMNEAAEALMLSKSGFSKWVIRDVIPRPIVDADIELGRKRSGMRKGQVYTAPELIAIMEIVGEHHSHIAYLRPSVHQEVISTIHQAVDHIRQESGIA